MRSLLLVLVACSTTMARPTHDQALARIHEFSATTRVAELDRDWGPPTTDIGSGIYIFVYPLADGGEVRVGTADGTKINYVVVRDATGEQKFDVR